MGCASSTPAQMPPPGGFEHYAPPPPPPQMGPPGGVQQQPAPAQDEANVDFSTLNIKQLQVRSDLISSRPSSVIRDINQLLSGCSPENLVQLLVDPARVVCLIMLRTQQAVSASHAQRDILHTIASICQV